MMTSRLTLILIFRMCTYHPKSKEDESTKTLTVVTNKLCQADFVPYCLKMLKEYADQMNSRDENKHTRKVDYISVSLLYLFRNILDWNSNSTQLGSIFPLSKNQS